MKKCKCLITLLCLMGVICLWGCGNAEEKISETVKPAETETPAATEAPEAQVGDIITFGSYEQDNDESDGKEPIEWEILKIEEDKIFVVSRFVIDAKPYNDKFAYAKWHDSSMRTWLNKTFFNEAFTAEEQAQTVSISGDRLFLMSLDEVNAYFPEAEDRLCGATEYAVAQGCKVNENYSEGGRPAANWWLSDTGTNPHYNIYVVGNGKIDKGGNNVTYCLGVRPTMWIIN